MLIFESNCPFPLLKEGSHTYPEAQLHSEAADEWLGLNTNLIETALTTQHQEASNTPQQQLWIGLPIKTLLTPYTEIRALLSGLNPAPGTTVVDLGAGYGRMGFVIGRHYPEVRFLGYEYVNERVVDGKRCLNRLYDSSRIELVQADLSLDGFCPVKADIYFMYDYGTRHAIEKTLQDLRNISRERPITVIGRGRLSRDLIERNHPWLSQVVSPQHFSHYSIYRTHET